MKKMAAALVFWFAFALVSAAQQTSADSPASKEDVERYMQVVKSQDMVNETINAMSKPMHDMIHQEYLKNSDKLPADFEARMNQRMDQMFKDLPWNDLLQTMVPIYQKHFPKGDIDALVAFYGGPTGQKILKEMPAITAELMQSMMPILQKNIEAMNRTLMQEMTAMMNSNATKSQPAQPQPNQ
jgi:hypothetical protein